MSEKLRESLSAILDDEANELELERVLSRISEEDELRQTWVRYCAVRSAMSGQAVTNLKLDISSSVRAQIASEGPRVGSDTGGRMQRLLRPVASFAVAASVAATVVIGGRQLAQLGAVDLYEGGRAVAAGASPVGLVNSLGASPVQASYGNEAIPMLQPATRTAYRELARQRMEKYIQEHAEHAALNSPHGLVPFARVPEIRE